MDVTWRKVWRDLWHHKARTILVVLATAAGIYSLGMTLGMASLMRDRLVESHRAMVMAHIRFQTNWFDQDVLDAIAHDPEVADVEGLGVASFRWRLEGETEWRDGELIARPDFAAQRLDRVELLEGVWPTRRALAVERLSSNFYGISPGTTVVIDLGQRERRLPVTSVALGQIVLPPQFGNVGTFYATPETLAWLTGQPEGFDRLFVRLRSFNRESVEAEARRIGQRLEALGLAQTDGGYFITDPKVHWAQEQIDTILFIMTVMSVLSLGLGGFLIVNAMNSVVAQQVWQVGVMKVFGATFWRVVRIYMAAALAYGLLALPLGVPAGAIVAYAVSSYGVDMFNVPMEGFQVAPQAVLVQIVAGLGVPLLAALVPVAGGVRATVRQALDTRGVGIGFGQGWLDRLAGRVRCLPRPLALSLRNTFRRKARIALTLTTLVLGGVMFVVVMSIVGSMNDTFAALFADLGHDVMVRFDRPYRAARLVETAVGVPDVQSAEVWSARWAMFSAAEGGQSEVYLWGVPSDSSMFAPRIVCGRSLLTGDDRAILLNNHIAAEEGIQLGDEIELTIGQRESTWTVVGLVLSVRNDQRESFVPLDALARAVGSANQGDLLMVATGVHDLETQQRVGHELDLALAAIGIDVSSVHSAVEQRETNQSQFESMTIILFSMAAMAGIVGSIGLASTMSINVIERAREIGVMRATGATTLAVAGIFVGEGVLVGLLSWLLAVPISYPSALLFGRAVGNSLIRVPLEFSYSIEGLFFWLLVVALLSALASLWPALQAARVSVREALAYE